jgi:acetyl/propionyl-CoA carboxylase alpha subunit
LEAASRRIVERCGFVGCASVEFLLHDGKAYFLEINGYIQPSYLASHAVSGIDLLKEQIKIHAGEFLSLTASDAKPHNHAISVSINAEDPSENFTPCPGHLERFLIKPGLGTTVYSTVWTGENVSTLYDPVIAQVVTEGLSRELAVGKLSTALNCYIVEGLKTNLPFLRALVSSDWFLSGEIDMSRTNHPQAIQAILDSSVSEEEETIAALVAAITLHNDSNSQQILEALESTDNYSFWNFTSRLISRNKLQS